jgi:hypothetical protein
MQTPYAGQAGTSATLRNVGVLLVATGKYYSYFFENLYKSSEKFFLPDTQKTYYVFTDAVNELTSVPDNVVIVYQEWEPFPGPTLHRYHYFDIISEVLKKHDYLFYTDVDMLFVDTVTAKDLNPNNKAFVAVVHPGFYMTQNRRGTPETNPKSKAFIDASVDFEYVAGGFQGGKAKYFLMAIRTMKLSIDADLKIGIIPVWHDESIYNKFVVLNKNNVHFCQPDMCFPQNVGINRNLASIRSPKLIALDKNHSEVRKK